MMGNPLLEKENEPSTLAKIVMEVETLPEEEKQLVLKQVRMRKAIFIAEKLKGSVLPNKTTISEIIAEQKVMHNENEK